MAITTTGTISIKAASGAANSIDTEMSAVSSGSLVALSEASIQYTGSDRGAVTPKDTDTSPYGMLEFSGYEHMSATETNYWSTTNLEADWAREVMSGTATAHADIKVYVVYNGNTIELWGLAYGDGNSAGGAPDYFPPTANYPDLDNYNTWVKGYQVAFSSSNPGYTVRYSYSQTSSTGSGLSYGFVHTGRGSGYNPSQEATMTTSAVSIDNSANQSLPVPNNNTWWGRSHATAASYWSGSNYTAFMREQGAMTFHFEKANSPTYTYVRNIDFSNSADSIDS